MHYGFEFDPENLAYPPGHVNFLNKYTAEGFPASAVLNDLHLCVVNRPYLHTSDACTAVCVNEIWELRCNSERDFVFTAPRNKPPVSYVINKDFTKGCVYGEFLEKIERGIYPFQSIEMAIYVNWLAKYDDLILHAAGVSIDGKGMAFVGSSGAGKSTLARALAQEEGVRMLGEDQLVLRYLEGKFYIFGTPWHDYREMCSPVGVPLEKIFLLDREVEQTLTNRTPFEGITRLMQTAFIPYYRQDKLPTLIDRLSLLVERVPCFGLSYRLGSDILPVITVA